MTTLNSQLALLQFLAMIKSICSSILSLVGSEKDGPSDSHVISGPLGQPANRNVKKRRRRSILAENFQNAWKQGNLAVEVCGEVGERERGWIEGKESVELRGGSGRIQPVCLGIE